MSTAFPIPAPHPLPAATHLGVVNLSVTDLAAQLAFYTRVIGLTVLQHDTNEARLGAGEHELLRLTL